MNLNERIDQRATDYFMTNTSAGLSGRCDFDAGYRAALKDPLVWSVIEGLDRWRNAWASQDTSDAEPARRSMFKSLDQCLAELGGKNADRT